MLLLDELELLELEDDLELLLDDLELLELEDELDSELLDELELLLLLEMLDELELLLDDSLLELELLTEALSKSCAATIRKLLKLALTEPLFPCANLSSTLTGPVVPVNSNPFTSPLPQRHVLLVYKYDTRYVLPLLCILSLLFVREPPPVVDVKLPPE